MRVGYINMTQPHATCPEGLYKYTLGSLAVCDRQNISSEGCNSTFFSSNGLQYMKVCGLIRGYQYGTVDAIYPNWGSNEAQFIDSAYIDSTQGITSGPMLLVIVKMVLMTLTAPVMEVMRLHRIMLGKIIIVSLLQQLNLLQPCFIPMTHCGMVNSVITMNLLAAPLLKCRGLLKL